MATHASSEAAQQARVSHYTTQFCSSVEFVSSPRELASHQLLTIGCSGDPAQAATQLKLGHQIANMWGGQPRRVAWLGLRASGSYARAQLAVEIVNHSQMIAKKPAQ